MTINDMVINGGWRCPEEWYEIFPVLNNIPVPNLNLNSADKTKWKDNDGNLVDFSTKQAWMKLSHQNGNVEWNKIV